MCHAAWTGNLDQLTQLVDGGAYIDSFDYDKRTAMHLAASGSKSVF